ncbi:MAG: type I restriction endonuclease subunit R [Bacteroidales bacterium]|nr:type I restriction endonuclease subunit R [Bacteroidales bacterium]
MANTYHYTEDSYEQSVLELFKELGYEYHYGPELEEQSGRDLHDSCIPGMLREAMLRINGADKAAAVDEALRKVHDIFSKPLLEANITLTDWLQNGMDVSFRASNGQIKSDHLRLIDLEQMDNNRFQVVNQWTIVNGKSTKRADIVAFLNGMPIAVIELKSPSREVTNSEEAHQQLQNYMRQVPQLFTAAQMLVISDMADTRVGTITAPLDRYMEWKTTDGSYESTAIADFETFFNGIFHKQRLLDIIANFTLTMGTDKKARILAGYHQYFAVKKALECTRQAIEREDGKIGVFWHTQGSGKSLSMVFYVSGLLKSLLSATILVLTDRLDLNDQLHSTFAACSDHLRQTPIKAEGGDHLYQLLEERRSHGIIFANIQKFSDRETPITTRHDLIVISDEAHRTQSNTQTRVNTTTGEIKLGFAGIVRKLLPNAAFIGFTGTPIERDDHDTRSVFGDYIDIYDMTQAVEDGATVPVYYESRLIKLNLDPETLRLLDQEYEKLAEEGAEEDDLKRSKQENAQLRSILHAPETIDTLCRDIVDHYENYRAHHLTGKAMIVALDRPTGIDIYKKLVELRPQWKEIIGVVMTQGNQDPVEWNDIIGSAARKAELARQFKDNTSKMKIAIVVDMWLTGFDVPSLATMYVYKPMKGHNLMQAIARVNRVFPEKSGGLVVDYIGIAQALKKAMHDYTGRDKKNYGDPNIATTAYEQFKEALSKCRECLNGYRYSKFATCSNLHRAKLIRGGVDILLNPQREEAKETFLQESKRLMQATTLCRSLLTGDERYEEAYFEAVRTLLVRLAKPGKITRKIIDERITALLKVAVKADGVVDILNTSDTEFSLFDEHFLKEVANMKEKNLAIEMLKKLLAEHIKKHQRKNMTQAEKFSEMLDAKLAEYLRGLISNDEVIKELLRMAQELKDHATEASELGLTEEEQAFYDALTRPQAVRDFYRNEELVAMTKELTQQLRNSKTIDWRYKESARAKMRSMVKRLLKKYKYPPEEQEGALDIVIKQCELWVDDNTDYFYVKPQVTFHSWQPTIELQLAAEGPSIMGESILIGGYKGANQLEWIAKTGRYNVRHVAFRGAVKSEAVAQRATQLLLYDVDNYSNYWLLDLQREVECADQNAMQQLDYPRLHENREYFLYGIKGEKPCPSLDIEKLINQYKPEGWTKGAPIYVPITLFT